METHLSKSPSPYSHAMTMMPMCPGASKPIGPTGSSGSISRGSVFKTLKLLGTSCRSFLRACCQVRPP